MKSTFALIAIFTILAFSACQAAKEAKSTDSKPKVSQKDGAAEPGSTKETAGNNSPSETMRTYYNGIKNKDLDAIKRSVSKESLIQMEEIAELSNKTLEDFLISSDDDLPKTMPEMRNEKIDGDTATLEVRDDSGKWDQVPFIKEDGAWKIAFDKLTS